MEGVRKTIDKISQVCLGARKLVFILIFCTSLTFHHNEYYMLAILWTGAACKESTALTAIGSVRQVKRTTVKY